MTATRNACPSAEALTRVIPSARQLRHQALEFYAFIHFTVNTFTDREWGDGTEDPAVFNPTGLDPRQWVREIAGAGMRGLILTCKHHDGFCLWPSRLTEHTVAASPCGRDVVAETAAACREAGLAFGVYLSPWDRHSPLYGTGKPYDDYFIGQLTELLTGYGEIFAVWLDGACGEGANGRRQAYDWARYYETIRRLQPEACISVCGPDVRWCGNEAGHTRPNEWSVVPARLADAEKVAAKSQQEDSAAFRLRRISSRDEDLGSRAALAGEEDLIWYPAEVNTSIRPGWFWHERENSQVRPLRELTEIYERSVGGNATFLLNIPPDKRGLLLEEDVRRLREFGAWLRDAFADDLLLTDGAAAAATSAEEGYGPENALGDGDTAWRSADGQAVWTATWPVAQPVRRVVLMEDIRLSQRAEKCAVALRAGGEWRTVWTGGAIGYKRIIRADGLEADAVRVTFLESRLAPTLQRVSVFR